jgi:gamma-glutamyltranspeptidase
MINANGPRTGRPAVIASRGMVSSPHYLASATGQDILRRGGSAVDAAIALNATLCVVYPHMAGLGGDAFLLIAGGAAKKVEAIDGSGPAAGLATCEYYRERDCTESIPMRGPLAALTVPGVVDAWRLAHERHGKLPWKELFADAIHYARNGMAISRSLADWLVTDESILNNNAEMARVFLPEGTPQRDGVLLKHEELAKTFEYLAEHGPRKGFYEGPVAKEMARALEEMGSPLRFEDFTSYQAQWVEPISSSYRGYQVCQMPPATQGFAALQILNLLELQDVKSWGANSADYYHNLVEAIKVAFADRDEWLSDPRYVNIPLDTLLSMDYARKRLELIQPEKALAEDAIEPGLRFGDV